MQVAVEQNADEITAAHAAALTTALLNDCRNPPCVPAACAPETCEIGSDSDTDSSLQEDARLLAEIAQSLPTEDAHEPASQDSEIPPFTQYDLPDYTTSRKVGFRLGDLEEAASEAAITEAYDEAVHFRPNAFSPPRGSVGKAFVSQLSRYLSCFGNAGTYDGLAMKVAMVFQQLLLQKPHTPTPISLSSILQRRLNSWNNGDLASLLHGCHTIQQQVEDYHTRPHPGSQNESQAKKFASLVNNGKLSAAVRELDGSAATGLLHLDEKIDGSTVRDVLRAKHPESSPPSLQALIQGDIPEPPHPVRFEALTREVMRKAV